VKKKGLEQFEYRGGWTFYKRHPNILPLIAFFCVEFHVTLNSLNPNLTNGGEHWGTLDILLLLHVSFKVMCVFS